MSESGRLKVAVIVGSTREGRFGTVPAAWIAERAREHGNLDVDVVDLAEAGLPQRITDPGDEGRRPEPVEALRPRIAAADAFIVVTPVYNRGYPASLKTAIDWFFDEWLAKAVGFVSYGGVSGGLYSVEQLRPIFNELHAVTIRNTLSFVDCWGRFDEEGRPYDSEVFDVEAKQFLDQLEWWAQALRSARAARPYHP